MSDPIPASASASSEDMETAVYIPPDNGIEHDERRVFEVETDEGTTIVYHRPSDWRPADPLAVVDVSFGHQSHTGFPPSFALDFVNLHTLVMPNLRWSGTWANISPLVHLRVLDVRGNHATRFPVGIAACTDLRMLSMQDNDITTVPAVIGALSCLRVLNLDRNELEDISSEIGKCTRLRTLRLNHNHLTKLPLEIGKLTRLRRLFVTNNKLARVPAWHMQNMVKLEEIHLNKNIITEPPVELGILTYWRLHSIYQTENRLSRNTMLAMASVPACRIGRQTFYPTTSVIPYYRAVGAQFLGAELYSVIETIVRCGLDMGSPDGVAIHQSGLGKLGQFLAVVRELPNDVVSFTLQQVVLSLFPNVVLKPVTESLVASQAARIEVDMEPAAGLEYNLRAWTAAFGAAADAAGHAARDSDAAAIEAYEDVMERPASPSSEASVDSTSHVDGADHQGHGADVYNQDSMQTFFEEMLAAGGGSGGGGGFEPLPDDGSIDSDTSFEFVYE